MRQCTEGGDLSKHWKVSPPPFSHFQKRREKKNCSYILDRTSVRNNQQQREQFLSMASNCGMHRRRVSPRVQQLRYCLEYCVCTSKRQFASGGLGLLAATGQLDFIKMLYMMVSNTKFGTERVLPHFRYV